MKSVRKLLLGLALFMGALAQAQVSVNVNIGAPPVWVAEAAPTARYYYLPDIATYYDVSANQYVYVSNKRWIRSRALPPTYRTYNFRGPKVVVANYNGNAPYIHHAAYVKRYPRVYRTGRPVAYVSGPRHHYKAVKHHGNPGHGYGHGHHGRH
ncbi:hypothetical protein Q765_16595 [Flavobacterium rivuli WB 3.3-2 = DSM 21788]|uniref:Uncharacterized protein n=1 Tax=Flavobacterium rivuli WB 3.3-2 = DSM 21788 TaxID=1121895 RepID=A0A0A2LY94_9FLAO|nr:hypothetical protein [Flavobacterium rivuli]KGO85362.1 hypothetical protein Q765_16595 [Flavobacterium rivuli WB 3.3-2 = DSM 21788]